LDSLQKFEAVVISGFVGATDKIVPEILNAVAYVPVLNLISNLVKEWGLASIVEGPATLTVPEDMTANALFADIDLSAGLAVFTEGNNVPALVLGDYFANDKVLALAGENVGIHQHNTSNSYM
ncbi:MAG: hypothetical protein K2K92_04300, partial [Duncaniella sp.]|nr:hypothetical protein [Duncaniella sp.]